ncbi:MAG: hemin uptake protein HemP [Alcaligenaceae bacterium]|nr:MAG: hemin uptake protein HemP [Alcaligenaceae bacterium]
MQATLTASSASSFFAGTPFDVRGTSDSGAASRQEASLAHSVDSSALLQGQKTVSISHNGSVYRLQATKLGKLILTK